jgi:hypothetical protein
MQVLRVEVRTCLFEKAELVFGDSYVFKLCTKLAYTSAHSAQVLFTVDLRLKPPESGAVEFLVGRTVGEAICDGHIGEKLEYATLHSQLVEICVQERKDALGQVGGVASHGESRGNYASKRLMY